MRAILLHHFVFYFCYSLLSAQQNVTKQTPEDTTLNSVTTETNGESEEPLGSESDSEESEEPLSLELRGLPLGCQTPNGDRGYCRPLNKCKKLQKKKGNKKDKKFLDESKCGPQNQNKTNPFVCCGKYSRYNVLPKRCGYQNITIISRIFGGVEAELGEFPWMAQLYYNKTKLGCTGFLIAQRYVLTAAHCIHSYGQVFEVRLGEHNTKTEIDCDDQNITCADKIQSIKVKKVLVHPNYEMNSEELHNDIGLIELENDAKITRFVSPICLARRQLPSSSYWLSGWGQTEQANTFSNIKLKVEVPFVPLDICKKKFNSIDNTQLCAGGEYQKDSCDGDSGGPLMVVNGNRWMAAGVVSYGHRDNCGKKTWPAVYTNIASYIPWITSSLLKWSKNR